MGNMAWVAAFLLLTLITGIFGFAGGGTSTGKEIAQLLFFVSLFFFVVSLSRTLLARGGNR